MQSLLAAATEDVHRSRREIQQQWLIALAIFVTGLWIYTRHNDFPFYYHADEPSKVTQLRDGTRNFNHPLLLLNAADVARAFTGGAADCQQIVEIGRWCSAAFAALAAALFSWVGFNRFGLIGGIASGVTLLIQRRLYEHAHFMKEDAALVAGVALTFVALDAFWRKPTIRRAALLGAATAMATSAKYIGVVMLPLVLIVLVAAPKRSSSAAKSSAALVFAFLIVLAAVNWQALLLFDGVMGGLGREMARLNSRSGVEVNFSRIEWLRRLLDLSPFLLILFATHLLYVMRNLRRLPLPDLLLAAFPFVLGFVLSFSSKQSGRHVLPALMVVALVASIALVRAAKELRARGFRFATPAMLTFACLAFLYDLVGTALLDRAFQRDHRRELVRWITANVPPTSTIGLEDRVGIPNNEPRRFCDERSPLPHPIRGARLAADLGTLEELRASGMTHIALIDTNYKTFVTENAATAQRANPEFLRRREFYQRLLTEGRLVWSRDPGNVGVLNPSLRLYEIAPPTSARSP